MQINPQCVVYTCTLSLLHKSKSSLRGYHSQSRQKKGSGKRKSQKPYVITAKSSRRRYGEIGLGTTQFCVSFVLIFHTSKFTSTTFRYLISTCYQISFCHKLRPCFQINYQNQRSMLQQSVSLRFVLTRQIHASLPDRVPFMRPIK